MAPPVADQEKLPAAGPLNYAGVNTPSAELVAAVRSTMARRFNCSRADAEKMSLLRTPVLYPPAVCQVGGRPAPQRAKSLPAVRFDTNGAMVGPVVVWLRLGSLNGEKLAIKALIGPAPGSTWQRGVPWKDEEPAVWPLLTYIEMKSGHNHGCFAPSPTRLGSNLSTLGWNTSTIDIYLRSGTRIVQLKDLAAKSDFAPTTAAHWHAAISRFTGREAIDWSQTLFLLPDPRGSQRLARNRAPKRAWNRRKRAANRERREAGVVVK